MITVKTQDNEVDSLEVSPFAGAEVVLPDALNKLQPLLS